jgi:hypothetical protein
MLDYDNNMGTTCVLKSWGFRRGTALILAALAVVGTWAHSGHMGGDFTLRIEIAEDGVRYDISGYGGLFPGIPSDARTLKLSYDKCEYNFPRPAQAERVQKELLAYLSDPNPVHIDGLLVKPVMERFEMLPNGAPEAEAAPELFPPDVRIFLHYPSKSMPRQVSLTWMIFAARPGEQLLSGPQSPQLFALLKAADQKKVLRFTEDEPEVVWHAPTVPAGEQITPAIVDTPIERLRIPVVAWGSAAIGILCLMLLPLVPAGRTRWSALGAAVIVPLIGFVALPSVAVVEMDSPWTPVPELPDEQQAAGIFDTLQSNIYRAFDYTKESDVYDVLVQSVDGKLLDRLYREVYESLILRDEGGAVAQVQEVKLLDTHLVSAGALEASESRAFKIAAHWQVRGVVTHWGHSHERVNEYRATYTVAERDQQWKIVGMTDAQQERVDPQVADGSAPSTEPAEAQQS